MCNTNEFNIFVSLSLSYLPLMELHNHLPNISRIISLVVYVILNELYSIFSRQLQSLVSLTPALGVIQNPIPLTQKLCEDFYQLFRLFLLYFSRRDLACIDFVALQILMRLFPFSGYLEIWKNHSSLPYFLRHPLAASHRKMFSCFKTEATLVLKFYFGDPHSIDCH